MNYHYYCKLNFLEEKKNMCHFSYSVESKRDFASSKLLTSWYTWYLHTEGPSKRPDLNSPLSKQRNKA
jgi:hypothetical protein